MMEISRDVFAAIAMHALLSRSGHAAYDFDIHNADSIRLACWSFEAADAMMAVSKATDEEITEMFAKRAKEKK